MEEKLLAFLSSNTPPLCVLSTVGSDGKPESAVVGYVIRDDMTILISTNKTTRKCLNIRANPSVSFVTGFSFNNPNVQIEGEAHIIESGDEYEKTDAFFFSKNPGAAHFKTPDTIFIGIKPTWVRFTDHTVTPGTVEEKTLS